MPDHNVLHDKGWLDYAKTIWKKHDACFYTFGNLLLYEQGTYTLLPGRCIGGCPLLHWMNGLNVISLRGLTRYYYIIGLIHHGNKRMDIVSSNSQVVFKCVQLILRDPSVPRKYHPHHHTTTTSLNCL